MKAAARLAGCPEAGVRPDLRYFPGWDPVSDSEALRAVKQAHSTVMHKDARVYAIHAGLECGLIQGRYPDLQCVSIGPVIEHAHSPDEQLLIPSVGRFYALLLETLDVLSSANKRKTPDQ
mmetsp:Transcript_30067/g.70757  ORF Transcript_30067/g.70757 Transcript_30067/m.70757 type:complete len:120 (-) Transcript_30067:13-372(-)